jgi:hypothetical protein
MLSEDRTADNRSTGREAAAMGDRNILLLAVLFVMVVAWNIIYFGGDASLPGPTPPQRTPPVALATPDASRDDRPLVSGTATESEVAAAPAIARRRVTAADISIGSDWGRSPFLTPAESRAARRY